MTGYESKRAAAQDKLVVTDIDGHVVRDARKPKKATALDKLDSMERKALKMALEALELLSQQPTDLALDYADNAINTLRERLAQPEQEPWPEEPFGHMAGGVQPAQKPVAWLEPEWGEKICPEVGYEVTMTDDHPRDLCWIPLYAQRPLVLQREWVDLTNEEIDKWAHELHGVIYAVMAELKEKNNG